MSMATVPFDADGHLPGYSSSRMAGFDSRATTLTRLGGARHARLVYSAQRLLLLQLPAWTEGMATNGERPVSCWPTGPGRSRMSDGPGLACWFVHLCKFVMGLVARCRKFGN